MEKVLDIVLVREKIGRGVKSNYRIVIPELVLERLGLLQTETAKIIKGGTMTIPRYIAFKKKSEDVQLVKIVAGTSAKKMYHFMGLAKIGVKGRICLPRNVVAFFNIANGDYLKLVELKKSDIRLRKVHVEHYYVPKTVLKPIANTKTPSN